MKDKGVAMPKPKKKEHFKNSDSEAVDSFAFREGYNIACMDWQTYLDQFINRISRTELSRIVGKYIYLKNGEWVLHDNGCDKVAQAIHNYIKEGK